MQIQPLRSHPAVPAATPPAQEPPDLVQIDLLHVNDVHGMLEPLKDPRLSAESTVGGLARMKTVIDREKRDNPEGTLVLNAGDLAEGTMVAWMTKGKSVAQALDAVGFDAIALGNHDFAWGQDALKGMLAEIEAPIVAANVVKTADGSVMEGASPYIVRDCNGVKVGIIGLDTPDMLHYVAASKLEGLSFEDGVKTVEQWLPEVRKQADVVVVLSHMGFERDCELARKVPGLDAIVGGHSHTELPEGHMEGNTLVAQAGSLSKFVGKVSLQYDPTARRIVGRHAQLIPVRTQEVEPDPEVAAIIAPYVKDAQKAGSKVMGEARDLLLHAHREAAKLNQIHADSLLEASGAELGICNSRTLRGHVKPGAVTFQDLYSALPFTEENYVTLKVPGRAVLQEIEDDLRDKATELAVPAGLRYEYDPRRPEGSRVTGATLADGSRLDPDREYTVVLNETMSRKPWFAEAPERKVLGPVQPLFFEAFTAGSPWSNDPDDRVRRLA